MYIDQSKVKHKSLGGQKNWLLVVDEATKFKWSYYLRKKSDQVEVLTGLSKKLKNKGKTVKMIRCNNAGESKALEKECEKQGLGVEFEYTAPGTPQHNGKLERAFQTLYGRVRAMLNDTGLGDKQRKLL